MNYFLIGGDKREYGPVDAELVRQWIREGRANAETMLRVEGETALKPLRDFAEFQEELRAKGDALSAPPPAIGEPADVPIGIAHAFGRAWHLLGEHFGVIAAATFLVWFILTALMFSCRYGPFLAMIFEGPLYGGLFLIFLQLIRTGEASPGQIFTLTRDNTATLMVTWLATTILSTLAALVCCILPGIYLYIAWLLALPIVADQPVSFWRGMEKSRRVVTRHWLTFFGLFLLAFLPVLVFHFYTLFRIFSDIAPEFENLFGSIAPTPAQVQAFQTRVTQVVASYAWWGVIKQGILLITLPLGIGNFAFVYEDLFGRKR